MSSRSAHVMALRSRSNSNTSSSNGGPPPPPENLRPIKITVVGDGTVGKTCLLHSFVWNEFPDEYVPTVFDNHAKNVEVDGLKCCLTLWDTAGQEEYEKLRPLSYPKTDCFILCYAINNRSSFANVEHKWIPELRHHCPKSSILLVGTKNDLRTEPELDELDPTPIPLISEGEGRKLKSKIKANGFLQCSAKSRDGLDNVFDEAVRSIMKQKKSSTIRSSRNRPGKSFKDFCILL